MILLNDEENFYNSIYSGSLFSNKKIITINNGTDKIIKQVKDIVEKLSERCFFNNFCWCIRKKI